MHNISTLPRVILIFTIVCLETASSTRVCDPDDVAFSIEMNDWRVNSGLRAMPISSSLVETARAHGTAVPTVNNGHDWAQDPSGMNRWSACSYNAQSSSTHKCMQNKPREVTLGTYTGNGYEISRRGGNPIQAWDTSWGHERYMMNSGGNVENAFGCSKAGYTSCWLSAQSEGSRPDNWGLCKDTSKRNSRCMIDGMCDKAGPCEWCGGGDWKCCKEGEVKNGCDGIEGRKNAHICVAGEDPPSTIIGICNGPNCFYGTPSDPEKWITKYDENKDEIVDQGEYNRTFTKNARETFNDFWNDAKKQEATERWREGARRRSLFWSTYDTNKDGKIIAAEFGVDNNNNNKPKEEEKEKEKEEEFEKQKKEAAQKKAAKAVEDEKNKRDNNGDNLIIWILIICAVFAIIVCLAFFYIFNRNKDHSNDDVFKAFQNARKTSVDIENNDDVKKENQKNNYNNTKKSIEMLAVAHEITIEKEVDDDNKVVDKKVGSI